MKITVKRECDIPNLFKESVHILAHLRYWEERFSKDHDADAKMRRNYWQEKADEFLSKLTSDIPSEKKPDCVKLEIEDDAQGASENRR